jgi:hypothetical protein
LFFEGYRTIDLGFTEHPGKARCEQPSHHADEHPAQEKTSNHDAASSMAGEGKEMTVWAATVKASPSPVKAARDWYPAVACFPLSN